MRTATAIAVKPECPLLCNTPIVAPETIITEETDRSKSPARKGTMIAIPSNTTTA